MAVIGIGQCSWDYLAVVDHFPEPDTKGEVHGWTEQGGGPVGTALIALRRLGIDTRFFGVAGRDPEGEKIRESFRNEGVDISGLAVRDGASSQKAFILVERGSGRRTILWQRPTGESLKPEELPEEFLRGNAFLHLDGLMQGVSLHAARAARQQGIPVMLDAGRVRPGMLDLAEHCDYVVGSEVFARDLGFREDPEAFLNALGSRFPGVFTFTLGSRGSYTLADGELFFQPAFSVDVVDTTGAGDVFHGAYIYGILQGWKLPVTLRAASAAAALSCRGLGGRTSAPTRQELDAFLASSSPELR